MNIPKYVADLILQKRLAPAPLAEQAEVSERDASAVYGYIWRLYRLNNTQYDSTLISEAERVTAWARREYAEANPIERDGAYHERLIRCFTTKEHRKPLYKRDYILMTITDPVASRLEKLIDEAKQK